MTVASDASPGDKRASLNFDLLGAGLEDVLHFQRTLLESMREGVMLTSHDGTVVFTNSAENRLLGYDPGELHGQAIASLSDAGGEFFPAVLAALQQAGVWEGNWNSRRRDGSVFASRVRITRVILGGATYWLSVREDATAERLAIEALVDSNARLEVATTAAAIGIWDWDLLKDEFVFSPKAQAIWGFEVPRIPVREVRERVHPADEMSLRLQAERAFDPKLRESAPYEYRILHPDGSVRWVLAHGKAIFSEHDGEPLVVRYVGTFQDISQRRALEDLSKETAQSLALALDAGRMAVWEYDVATDSVESSAKLNRILGFSEEARPTLDDYRSGYEPGEEQRLQEIGARLMEQGERFMEAEYRYRWPDGTPRWLLLRCEIMLDAGGQPERTIGVVMDITERKEAEIARAESERRLRELNESLERRVEVEVSERAKAEQAWRQAQKMEAVGRLTGGIAHDFNNLLMSLTSALELIRRRPEDVTKVQRWAEAGLQSAERGRQLTRQLLAFSRVQKLKLRPVDAAGLLDAIRDLLAPVLGPLVRLQLRVVERPAAVFADRTQLELAVMNLAINARDAMPRGGDLTISLAKTVPPLETGLNGNDYLAITVTDTGSGMDADAVHRAFDPFFTTKAIGKGTGLGLSQVQAMAVQAGGAATLSSTPGKGTRVTIILPRCADVLLQDEPVEPDHGDFTTNLRVLIVDDDAAVRRSVIETLLELGCSVREADSGEAGLAAIEGSAPDILLLDYAMPGCNGAEVAERARGWYPDLPILFLTGFSETAVIEAAVGPDASILRKPFRIAELQSAMRLAIRRSAEAAGGSSDTAGPLL